jgi:16S rRNA (guanine527-N7)-methyltransferase
MRLGGAASAGELQAGFAAAAASLNIQLGPAQLSGLSTYVKEMQRWNAVHSLNAANDAATLMLHVVDCLAIVLPFAQRLGRDGVRVLDAGTGPGLPAAVLSIALPGWTVTAVDAVGKKIAFVRHVAGELGLGNLRAVHSRLEHLKREDAESDLITSRAFSSLQQFVERTRHLLSPDGWWAAMKGKLPDVEISELPANCQLFHVEQLTVPGLNADRCLVWLKPASP